MGINSETRGIAFFCMGKRTEVVSARFAKFDIFREIEVKGRYP